MVREQDDIMQEAAPKLLAHDCHSAAKLAFEETCALLAKFIERCCETITKKQAVRDRRFRSLAREFS